MSDRSIGSGKRSLAPTSLPREAAPLSEIAQAHAAKRLAALATPPGALGRLGEYAVWLSATQGRVPPTPLREVRLLAGPGPDLSSLAAAHGVTVVALPTDTQTTDTQAETDLRLAGAALAHRELRAGTQLFLLADPWAARTEAQRDAFVQTAVGVLMHAAHTGVPVVLSGDLAETAAALTQAALPGADLWFLDAAALSSAAEGDAPARDGATTAEATGTPQLAALAALAGVPILRSAVAVLRDVALLAELVP
ncbi:nicotinate-nucleotide--dimethylbenzimidazole phosphoribosyltransferase [Nocardioides sp.]|uniref:nicotinate-nucleotide--dimethylbenzimidazole phosphoribosyltransferase n=1 Tax=Nocardioides sp. TaxID=35761 RepID=UPI002607C161|nr:nicotinate-nucleotide--dimethylbenzimidazole phosphoribosyltransferase [Nocardioides sp.]